MQQNYHKSVLLNEILIGLNASKEGLYVDATFGAGGYSEAILESNDKNQVIAFDRDKNVERFALNLQKKFPQKLSFINQRFSQISASLAAQNIDKIDGIVLDLGVSSMQLDEGERGFSFNKDAALNMQMGLNNVSAYNIVNETAEEDLANIIFQYGEERESRKIARRICRAREKSSIETTLQLAEIVEQAKSFKRNRKIHPATKTFQAIRIFVNEELKELKEVLAATINLLNKGGRLVVVSFHGLEDKIVKSFIKEHAVKAANNRYMPEIKITEQAEFKLVTNGLKPTILEISDNPRARSAIMRVAEKL